MAATTASSLPSSALTPWPRPTAPATSPAERTPGLALNLDTRPAPSTTGQGPGPAQPLAAAPAVATLAAGTSDPGCKDTRYTTLSRFWELEPGSDCGTFGIRGYRPISLSLIASDSVNTAPASPSPEHTASFSPYLRTETRIQLSVRTKLAQGLLTRDHPTRHDSLWFGYTQQSYWQLFTGALSRPFRNTDHEPELVYVYPTDTALPRGWRWRYAGLGVVHQSNGQTLPLSRSWNRVYLMGGMERDDRWRLTGRVWQRLPEKAATDDNPDISDTVGRAELMAAWHPNPDHTLSLTLRHSLRATARGSLRLEWLRALGDGGPAQQSGLRFHTQLFSGYGDSLVDYNRRRTVLSVGLSLVDF